MPIPFTQYLRPDGRQNQTSIERPVEIEEMAVRLRAVGVRFEVEELTTGEASLEAVRTDEDGEPCSVAIEIVPNGPGVGEAVDRLVRAAYESVAAGRVEGVKFDEGQG